MKIQKIAISVLLLIVFVPPGALCQTKAQEYYNRGGDHVKAGLYDEAITDYSKAIELDPRYAEAYSNRGFVYGRKGQFDAAIADYNKAIELNPKIAEVYNNRGFVYGARRPDRM